MPRKRVLVLSDPVDDRLSAFEKERATRQRLVATTGRCPCGAALELPEPAPGAFLVASVEHEPDCPAVHDPSGAP
jgi:hypothetical protein